MCVAHMLLGAKVAGVVLSFVFLSLSLAIYLSDCRERGHWRAQGTTVMSEPERSSRLTELWPESAAD